MGSTRVKQGEAGLRCAVHAYVDDTCQTDIQLHVLSYILVSFLLLVGGFEREK